MIKTKVVKNAWGEWQVKVWENGKRKPEADYFTDDKQDAKETAEVMEKD